MGKRRPGHYILLFSLAATAAGEAYVYGPDVRAAWTLPLLLAGFVLAYTFDVPLPGLGRTNADHLVAFPAALLLDNPAAAGAAAAAGYLASRLWNPGPRKMGLSHAVDTLQLGVSVTTGTGLVRALGAFTPESSNGRSLMVLAAGAWLQFGVSLVVVAIHRAVQDSAGAKGGSFWGGAWRSLLWLTLSIPYLGLVLFEIASGQVLEVVLSLLPLLSIAWVLRLTGEQEQKNAALVESSRRQEFLLQMLASESGSLENESFLKNLLTGLNEFIPWDAELVFVVETPFQREPILFSRTGLPMDPHGAKARLEAFLDEGALQLARSSSGRGTFGPLLIPGAAQQMVVPLATREVAFGALVVEREGDRPFTETEVQFVSLALGQIGRYVQDEILKRQILSTNRRLVHQTHYLSEILDVSKLLKIHMDARAILEKVAQGIRDGLGFQSVLVSLYREEEGVFERVAQAGEDARWDEIRKARPPASEILGMLQERYRTGSSYYIRNAAAAPFHVMPSQPRPRAEADDWDPSDFLLVPMQDKDNRLIGILSVDEPMDGKIPSMEALSALEIIANQAVQALESSQVHALVRHQAVVDGLTGLYNHRHFHETLVRVAREHAASGRPFAVLMMDLDNFKATNDRWGHLAGDAVLRGIGEVVFSVTRKEDLPARYGGEEFAVILPGLDAERAAAVAERVRRLVAERAFEAEGTSEPVRVTVSVGVAAYPEHGEDHRRVLDQADAALYRAKKAGKNRVWREG